MSVDRGVGEQHLGDALKLCGFLRNRPAVCTHDQDVNVASKRPRRGQGLGGRVLHRALALNRLVRHANARLRELAQDGTTLGRGNARLLEGST